jgi:hypothetical protein
VRSTEEVRREDSQSGYPSHATLPSTNSSLDSVRVGLLYRSARRLTFLFLVGTFAFAAVAVTASNVVTALDRQGITIKTLLRSREVGTDKDRDGAKSKGFGESFITDGSAIPPRRAYSIVDRAREMIRFPLEEAPGLSLLGISAMSETEFLLDFKVEAGRGASQKELSLEPTSLSKDICLDSYYVALTRAGYSVTKRFFGHGSEILTQVTVADCSIYDFVGN